ncbi:MAG: hypothetical protein B7Y33_02375 [Hydrogenophilales bacterium 16-62-9]|nr:MAG: hypothetical protein B7Y33_02375 [Hydrogenophilales bacterium 16-62-9]
MIVADDNDDYVGEIRIYAGIQEPEGWMFCDGREVSAQSYPALAHALGYVWGGGGPRFRIPDLRGRLTVGEGKGTGMTQRTHARWPISSAPTVIRSTPGRCRWPAT